MSALPATLGPSRAMPATKTKTQHYVPRVVLRGFSRDGRSISVFLLKSRKRISGASIGDQCAKHLFYGEDGIVEKAFADLEGEFGAAIGDRSPTKLEGLNFGETEAIRFFVMLQRHRTVAAGEAVNAAHDGMARRIFEKDPRIAELGVDLKEFTFGYAAPHLMAIRHALTSLPVLLDLELKFLVTKKKPGFILSDDPVALFNQYAERSPEMRKSSTIGFAMKGLQIFMPISSSVCVALYDPTTYAYGPTASAICSPSVQDIKTLNTLQALNARQCLYFDPSITPPEELDRVADEAGRHEGWRNPIFLMSEVRKHADGGKGQILCLRTPQVHLPFQFGFARLIDGVPETGRLPIRSPELVAMMEQERFRHFPGEKAEREAFAEKRRTEPEYYERPWRLRIDKR